jgi:hypothetical protein
VAKAKATHVPRCARNVFRVIVEKTLDRAFDWYCSFVTRPACFVAETHDFACVFEQTIWRKCPEIGHLQRSARARFRGTFLAQVVVPPELLYMSYRDSRTQSTCDRSARPAVDEWGIYDPSQAGLEALFEKLDAKKPSIDELDAAAIATSIEIANKLNPR